MYLIDSNIILELLLEQEKANEVERLLRCIPTDMFYLSEFLLYSVGLVLVRKKRYDTFTRLIKDLLINGEIRLVRLSVEDMDTVAESAKEFNLDFDDAYQYTAEEKYKLIIVSFDADFDRTKQGRKTPTEVMNK